MRFLMLESGVHATVAGLRLTFAIPRRMKGPPAGCESPKPSTPFFRSCSRLG